MLEYLRYWQKPIVGRFLKVLYLGDDVVDHVSVDIGESHISAAKAEGGAFVIEAEEVKHGGVEVMNFEFVFDDVVAECVGGSVSVASFDASASHP